MTFVIWLNNQIIAEVPDEATHFRVEDLVPTAGYRLGVSRRATDGESDTVNVDFTTEPDTWSEALTNESPDSGFEHSFPDAGTGTVSGWTLGATATTTRLGVDQTVAFEGSNSLRITGDSTATTGPSTFNRLLEVIPGEPIVASAWLRTPSAKQAHTVIHWLDNMGIELEVTQGELSDTAEMYWTRISASGTAPGKAAWVYAEFIIDGQSTGEIYWLDDAMISRAAAPTEYGDGDDANWEWVDDYASSRYLSTPNELTELGNVRATDVWAHSALIQWDVDPEEADRTVTIKDGSGATLAEVDKWRGCYRLIALDPNTKYTYSLYQALTNNPGAGISPATALSVLTTTESWVTGMTNYLSSPAMDHNGPDHDITPWTKLAEDSLPPEAVTTTDALSVVGEHSICITGRDMSTPTGISSKAMNGQYVYSAIPYTATLWFRATEQTKATIELAFVDNDTVIATEVNPFGIAANTWVRLHVTATAPVTADGVFVRVYNPQHPYQSYYYDGGMLVQGSRVCEYGDGTSPNWLWVDGEEGGQSVHGEAIPPFPLAPENFRARNIHFDTAELVWDVPDTADYNPDMTINARVQFQGEVIYDDTARLGGPAYVTGLSQETAYEATCYFYTPDYGVEEKASAPATARFTTPFRYWPAGLINYAYIPSFSNSVIGADGAINVEYGPTPVWTANKETAPQFFALPAYPETGTVAQWKPQFERWAALHNWLYRFPLDDTTQPHAISAAMNSQSATHGLRIGLVYFDADGNEMLGTDTISAPITGTPNTWKRPSWTGTPPDGAVSVSARLRFGYSDDLQEPGETFAFDRIMLTQGSRVWAYADPETTPGWMWQEKTGGRSEFLMPESDEFFRNGDDLYFLTNEDEPTLDRYAPNRRHSFTASTEKGTTEGSVLHLEGFHIFTGPNVPYEEGYVYQLAISMRQVTEPKAQNGLVYVGFCGVAEDGETLINSGGADTYAGHFYCAYSRETVDAAVSQYTSYGYRTGYMSGTEAPISAKGKSPDQFNPLKMYEGTKYVRPMIYVNYRQPDGVVDIDRVTVTRQKVSVLDLTPENFRAEDIDPTQATLFWDINGEADDALMARILIGSKVVWDGPASQGATTGATVYSLSPETAYTAAIYLYSPAGTFTGETRSPEVTAEFTTAAAKWPQGLTNWLEYGVFVNQQKNPSSNFSFTNASGEVTWLTEQLDFTMATPAYADVGKVAQMKKATNHYTTDNYLESQTLIPASGPLTFSMYMYPQTAAAVPLHSRVNWTNTNGDTVSTSDSETISATERTWNRVTQANQTPPDDAVNAQIEYAYTNKTSPGVIGESALLTRAMATYGATVHDYGDPYCEPGWFWTNYPDGTSQYAMPLYDEYFLNENLLYFYENEDFAPLGTYAPNRSHSFVSSSELGTTKGTVLRLNQFNCFDGPLIPYEDGYVYQIAISMRQVTQPSGTTGLVYTGFTGVAADGVTRISRNGTDQYDSQMYCAYSRVAVEAPLTRWTNYGYAAGYASGTAVPSTVGQRRDQYNPALMYTGTAYVRPCVIVNYQQASGVVDIDRLTVTRRPI
ncbi:hypothetical protein [Streptomyces sp. NBC_00470]|uniref:hypothetical protein n=1 Tax=Streptomyces sp. NBC_00470 TaxID=2975753 RepID=UPI00324F8539